MMLAEVEEAYEKARVEITAFRKVWPKGDVAVYDGDGIERLCANGEQCFLTEEDAGADDWVVIHKDLELKPRPKAGKATVERLAAEAERKSQAEKS